MYKPALVGLVVIWLSVSAACAPAAQTQSATTQAPTVMTPTATTMPSHTLEPSPTATSEPTATNTPVPTRAPTRPAREIPILPPDADAYEDWLVLFDYDQQAPLDLKQEAIDSREGVNIYDVSYASPIQGSVKAYLVVPPGEGPFAGILFFHWYDPGSATNNRTQFLEEAVELAKGGAVSLLIQGAFPWSRSPSTTDVEADRERVVRQVLDLRRGIDVLVAQPGVDAGRLGFVGHDFGAMYGSILAGIDQRIKTYILMAGTGRFANWFLKYWPSQGKRDVEGYKDGMAAVDPVNYLGHAMPATLYFQFAEHDEYVSEADAQEQFEAGSQPKSMRWYAAGHEMNEIAARDRLAWLQSDLGLK